MRPEPKLGPSADPRLKQVNSARIDARRSALSALAAQDRDSSSVEIDVLRIEVERLGVTAAQSGTERR
jgi:hypothetical protein